MQIQKLIYTKRLAKQFGLKPIELGVLTTIAVHYNHFTGECFPSQSTIAEILDVARETVNRAIKALIGKSLVSAHGKIGESKTYNFTELFFNAILAQDDQKDTCDKKSHGGVTQDHRGCDKKSHKQINEHDNITFQKNNFKKPYNQQQQGITYLSSADTKKLLEEKNKIKRGSPLDFTKDQAEEWLKNLMPELQNSYFAREVRKKFNIPCRTNEIGERCHA